MDTANYSDMKSNKLQNTLIFLYSNSGIGILKTFFVFIENIIQNIIGSCSSIIEDCSPEKNLN